MVGFFQVVGQVGRTVAQSVEVTPKRSKERGEWSQRLRDRDPQRVRDSRDSVSKSPVDLASRKRLDE